MSRITVTLTENWQLLSSVEATFTIQKSDGTVLVNETASDVNANRDVFKVNAQIRQTEAKTTYMRVLSPEQNVDVLVDTLGA